MSTRARNARCLIRCCSSGSKLPVVLVELHSGRFHQIRASFAHVRHPLVGDVKYGADPHQGSQSLCAFRLSFSIAMDNSLAYLNERIIELPAQRLPRSLRTAMDRHV